MASEIVAQKSIFLVCLITFFKAFLLFELLEWRVYKKIQFSMALHGLPCLDLWFSRFWLRSKLTPGDNSITDPSKNNYLSKNASAWRNVLSCCMQQTWWSPNRFNKQYCKSSRIKTEFSPKHKLAPIGLKLWVHFELNVL